MSRADERSHCRLFGEQAGSVTDNMPKFKVKDIFVDYFQNHTFIESERVILRLYNSDIDVICSNFSKEDWSQIFIDVDEDTFNSWDHYIDRVVLTAFDKKSGKAFGFMCVQESHDAPMRVYFHGGVWKHDMKNILLEYEGTDRMLHFMSENGMEVHATCLLTNTKAHRFQISLGFEEYRKDAKLSYKILKTDKLNTNIIARRKQRAS